MRKAKASQSLVIAIDGPAGSGKSTVSRRLAQLMGICYLDTGAMYRAITFSILENGIPLSDIDRLRQMVRNLQLSISDGRIFVNGKDVSERIRSSEVTSHVSFISSLDFVREKMVELQRKIGKNRKIVVEGRDIGTVVFPDAQYKFFLDATVEERARRRLCEESNRDTCVSSKEVMDQIKKRDAYDSTRELSPLRKASDALYIDSTHMSIDEVCNLIRDKIQRKQQE